MNNIENIPNFIRALPEIALPVPGVQGWLIQGDLQQVIFVEFSETIEFPEHTHSDQWEIPIAGSVILHINGDSREYRPGEKFYIPPDLPHAATVSSGYKAIIIFNSPDRYKCKE